MNADEDTPAKAGEGAERQSARAKGKNVDPQGAIFPSWRVDVQVDDIPVLWSTNLDDRDLRLLYLILKDDSDFDSSGIKVNMPKARGSLSILISLNLFRKSVVFKDGYCEVVGPSKGSLKATYRSTKDWELWNAHQQELEEFREDQGRERKAEQELFKAQDTCLEQQIRECLECEEYLQIPALIKLRFDLRDQYKHLRPQSYRVKRDAMLTFCRFPTTDAGIEFLGANTTIFYEYERFADQYQFWNAGKVNLKNGVLRYQKVRDQPDLTYKVDKIFRAAIARFPREGRLYVQICRFWRRNAQVSLAIEYCQYAIDKSLSDGSKTGFEGMLKRLRKTSDRWG